MSESIQAQRSRWMKVLDKLMVILQPPVVPYTLSTNADESVEEAVPDQTFRMFEFLMTSGLFNHILFLAGATDRTLLPGTDLPGEVSPRQLQSRQQAAVAPIVLMNWWPSNTLIPIIIDKTLRQVMTGGDSDYIFAKMMRLGGLHPNIAEVDFIPMPAGSYFYLPKNPIVLPLQYVNEIVPLLYKATAFQRIRALADQCYDVAFFLVRQGFQDVSFFMDGKDHVWAFPNGGRSVGTTAGSECEIPVFESLWEIFYTDESEKVTPQDRAKQLGYTKLVKDSKKKPWVWLSEGKDLPQYKYVYPREFKSPEITREQATPQQLKVFLDILNEDNYAELDMALVLIGRKLCTMAELIEGDPTKRELAGRIHAQYAKHIATLVYVRTPVSLYFEPTSEGENIAMCVDTLAGAHLKTEKLVPQAPPAVTEQQPTPLEEEEEEECDGYEPEGGELLEYIWKEMRLKPSVLYEYQALYEGYQSDNFEDMMSPGEDYSAFEGDFIMPTIIPEPKFEFRLLTDMIASAGLPFEVQGWSVSSDEAEIKKVKEIESAKKDIFDLLFKSMDLRQPIKHAEVKIAPVKVRGQLLDTTAIAYIFVNTDLAVQLPKIATMKVLLGSELDTEQKQIAEWVKTGFNPDYLTENDAILLKAFTEGEITPQEFYEQLSMHAIRALSGPSTYLRRYEVFATVRRKANLVWQLGKPILPLFVSVEKEIFGELLA